MTRTLVLGQDKGTPPITPGSMGQEPWIGHGEPSGLRTRMRLADKGLKTVGFNVTEGRWCHVTGLWGGV